MQEDSSKESMNVTVPVTSLLLLSLY